MGRVTAYRASDNELLPTRKAWFRHEANLMVKAELAKKLAEQVQAELAGATAEEIEAEVGKRLAVVTSVGIDTMRDWFDLTFKPSAEDGEEGGEAPAAAAPAAAPAAPAQTPDATKAADAEI